MAVYVYDAPGCGEKYKLTQHKGAISAVAISADGSKLASGCSNKEVVVWDLGGGTKLHAPGTGFHPGRISCLAWGPGGDGLLASGAISGHIIVWDFSNSAPTAAASTRSRGAPPTSSPRAARTRWSRPGRSEERVGGGTLCRN